MSPASPSLPSSDSRLKWRKRKRESNPKRPKPQNDDEDDDDDDEDEEPIADLAAGNHSSHFAADPVLDLRQSEVLSDGGHRISDFPAAFRRSVTRPHPSVLALVAADRRPESSVPFVENISHGQLQSLSAVLPESADPDKPSAYVCTPPPLMDSKGIVKRLGNDRLLLVPRHADWFSPSTVHRLERQIVPHFFSGKSDSHTPERFMNLRNKIVSRYMEEPGRRLSFADCQGLVPNGELYDLSRIVRFLDHWGIINYLAASSLHRGLRMAPSLLKEEANGELQLQTAPLRSIDSLILFDRPKCSLRMEDAQLLLTKSSSAVSGSEVGFENLDSRIRERLSQHACSYCSRPLPQIHYQSQKEGETILCSDCFHDAKFIAGHSSVDFVRVDSEKDAHDPDGDNWTDQETLLLLEAMEKYNDNWNEIAEHVGTKSKAQCILHFVRLPMEDGLLENIEIPHMAEYLKENNHGSSYPNCNGDVPGSCVQDFETGKQLPFANCANPVMSLVAFLASSIGPRVAAACANASLSVLTNGDSRLNSENTPMKAGSHGLLTKNRTPEDQLPDTKNGATCLDSEHVKFAAMCGLSAAAVKSKLFADQEEREIQRLAATIINHQLKRLELKLKQFAEIETLLLKECEQVERTRQRLWTERSRMITTRFGSSGAIPVAAAGANSASAAKANIRQPSAPSSVGPAAPTPAYGNSLPVAGPSMSYMQRQQMFGFGPRLPLSAIHPSAPSQNVAIGSGVANTSSNPNQHPLLRSSSSGNNTNIGGH